MQRSQNLIFPKINHLIELSKLELSYNQLLDLYENILQFINEEVASTDITSTVIILLQNIKNQMLFQPLFQFIVARFNNFQSQVNEEIILINFIFSRISKFHDKNLFASEVSMNIQIMDILLTGKSVIYQKIIQQLKSSQTKSFFFLHWINNSLTFKMKSQKIINKDLTPSTLFSFKVIQSKVQLSFRLVQEALRHILIVDTIQRGVVLSFILSHQSFLSSLESLGEKPFVSGYWYFLIAKSLQSHYCRESMNVYENLIQIAQRTYSKILNSVNFQGDLTKETLKIRNSEKSQQEKLSLLYQIRGYVYFFCSYMKNIKSQQGIDNFHIKMIESFMGIQDFLCYQYLISTYVDLLQKQIIKIDQVNIQKLFIQENCLPLYHEPNEITLEYTIKDVQFLSFQLQNQNNIIIPQTSSLCMNKMIQLLLESQNHLNSHDLSSSCSEYIHSTIQKQYDNQFNSHQFMSACHLMCRSISRLINMDLSTQQEELLKNYLITNIKWLLNLNQSCLPQNRRCINLQIFELIIAYPNIFEKNEFLEIVIYDLLINRYPLTKHHLKSITTFYRQNTHLSSYKLQEKLFEKLNGIHLKLVDRLQLWDILMGILQSKGDRLKEIIHRAQAVQFNSLAKLISLKTRQIAFPQSLQLSSTQEYNKIKKYLSFFKIENLLISKVIQR